MAFGKSRPFSINPFATEDPSLVEVPKAPVETHEKRTRPRSYLANTDLSDVIGSALSPLLPGAPRPSRKVEVEKVREVEKVPEAPTSDGPQEAPKMPKWGRVI